MEKSLSVKELEAARKRLRSVQAMIVEADKTVAYADKNHLSALAGATSIRLNRYRKTEKELVALVSDLEKASGALPLK